MNTRPSRLRFAFAGVNPANISVERDTFTFQHPGTPASFVELFRDYYGPTMNAFEAAQKRGLALQLQDELEALVVAQNKSSRPDTTIIPATYLWVTVTLPNNKD